MRSSLAISLSAALLAFASGCEQAGPMVYVLAGPQEVTLTASASASKVTLGESVVLHVERRTRGQWKQIPQKELRPGQCWQYRPPPESEPEVADKVEWHMAPKDAVIFNSEFRMDHKRVATPRVHEPVTLIPLSSVPCEPGRVIQGPTIEIEVT